MFKRKEHPVSPRNTAKRQHGTREDHSEAPGGHRPHDSTHQNIPQSPAAAQYPDGAQIAPPSSPDTGFSFLGQASSEQSTTGLSSALQTLSTEVQPPLGSLTASVFAHEFPDQIDTAGGQPPVSYQEQREWLLLELLTDLPNMSSAIQERAAMTLFKQQILPFLDGRKHTPHKPEHINGYHCSQLELKQKKKAPMFLPGLTMLLHLFDQYSFTKKQVEDMFLEHQLSIAYLQSICMHTHYPYEKGWRCGGCLAWNEIMSIDVIRFMHVKACENPKAGGVNLRKAFSAMGTSYTEDHYGLFIGYMSTAKSLIKKIVPASSYSGNVWRLILDDPELIKFLILLWPIELGTPTNVPKGMRVWYTQGMQFTKPTFLDTRQMIDAGNDTMMMKVDGQLASVDQCDVAMGDIEAGTSEFIQQLASERRDRAPAAQLQAGGMVMGAELFLGAPGDEAALFHDLGTLEDRENKEETEDFEESEDTDEVEEAERIEGPEAFEDPEAFENPEAFEDSDGLEAVGMYPRCDSSEKTSGYDTADEFVDARTSPEPPVETEATADQLIDFDDADAGLDDGPEEDFLEDSSEDEETAASKEAQELIDDFDMGQDVDSDEERERKTTSSSTLVSTESPASDDDTTTKALKTGAFSKGAHQVPMTAATPSTVLGPTTAARRVFSELDLSSEGKRQHNKDEQATNKSAAADLNLPTIVEEDEEDLEEALNKVCADQQNDSDLFDEEESWELEGLGGSRSAGDSSAAGLPPASDSRSASGDHDRQHPERQSYADLPPEERLFSDDDETGSLYDA